MKYALILALVVTATGCTHSKQGILIMAHGGESAWNETVEATVEPLRGRFPVEIAYGMALPSTIETGLEALERRGVERVAVVRMFISGESFLDQTEYILGMREEEPPPVHGPEHGGFSLAGGAHAAHAHGEASHARAHDSGAVGHHFEPLRPVSTDATILLSRQGIGDSPLVDEILVDRVRALSTNPSEESVLLLAHGPADDAENERWLANMRERAGGLHEIGPFRHVECETLREDWPDRRAEAVQRIRNYLERGAREGGRVIVVPFRLAGFGPYKEVLEGLDYVADGRGLCPHPNITRWIEQTAEKCFASR